MADYQSKYTLLRPLEEVNCSNFLLFSSKLHLNYIREYKFEAFGLSTIKLMLVILLLSIFIFLFLRWKCSMRIGIVREKTRQYFKQIIKSNKCKPHQQSIACYADIKIFIFMYKMNKMEKWQQTYFMCTHNRTLL